MDIKKQAISGAKWTTVATITTAGIQILRLAILTRFLDKGVFGVVAILTFVLGLTNTFADLGFSASIMHKQDISQKEFSSLYWIQMLFFVILFLIGCALSPLVSFFYKEESITYLLPIMLLDLILNGVGRLYDTVLQKEMLFKTIAIRNVIAALASIIVAFVLAYNGFGIYSMIISTLFQTALFNIWNFICGQKHIKLVFSCSFKESLSLAKIGFYQTGTQILDYIGSQFDILIIGRLLGTDTLGLYNLAKELVMKVILLINSIANKIVLPIFAKIQGDKEALKNAYFKILELLARIDFPISAVLFSLSVPIVRILYGDSFMEVGALMSILSIWSLFVCIGNPVGNLAIATGRTDLSFKYTIIRVAITIPVICIASLFNIYVVAFSVALLSILMAYVVWRIQIYAMINVSLKQYISSFSVPLMKAIAIGGIMFIIVRYNPLLAHRSPYLQLVVYGFVFVLLYFRDYYKIYQSVVKK